MSRREFVAEVEALLRKTEYDDICLAYGTIENGKFERRDCDINIISEYEVVLIKRENQSDEFGVIQSIEADGKYFIMRDIINAVGKL